MAGKGGSKKRKLNMHTPEDRVAIVAESFAPGATVAGVARRHGVQPSLLSSWRTKEQGRKKSAANAEPKPSFAAVEIASDEPVRDCAEGVEIVTGSVVICLPAAMPAKRIVKIAVGLARP